MCLSGEMRLVHGLITRGAWGVNERSEPMNNLVQMTHNLFYFFQKGVRSRYMQHIIPSFSTDPTCKICCRESLDR